MMSFTYVFFFNDTATTEIYTLSLHDALPICVASGRRHRRVGARRRRAARHLEGVPAVPGDRSVGGPAASCVRRGTLRSEEHTSELQSRQYLVCRLLLEKKKKNERRHLKLLIK